MHFLSQRACSKLPEGIDAGGASGFLFPGNYETASDDVKIRMRE